MKSRTVNHTSMRLGDLLLPVGPLYRATEEHLEAREGLLAQLGQYQAVVAYQSAERGGLTVLLDEQIPLVLVDPDAIGDVTIVDLDDSEAATARAGEAAILDDLLKSLDSSALDALIREASTDSPAVAALLDALAQEHGIVPGVEAGDGGDDFDTTPDDDGPTRCQLGDLWVIGGVHRLLVGDCTDPANVARLMQGERAALCHADPPYGMGKEKDGIANDNLYREKLDTFQIAWWRAARPFLEHNAGAYIWGVAEDLWRLWYAGGLCNSERLTLRNEIVWQKQGGQGIGSDSHRMYPTTSERCLFFMLGEQGFNVNADNYWDGWTSIVAYLEAQRQAAGWSVRDTKRIAGHSEQSGCHWFDKSQWSMPTREVYNAWRHAANGAAFKREYDDLKREFYDTRAYFDNTHSNMTDVWDFPRVSGDERHDHATPKPLPMIERVKKAAQRRAGLYLTPSSAQAQALSPHIAPGGAVMAWRFRQNTVM